MARCLWSNSSQIALQVLLKTFKLIDFVDADFSVWLSHCLWKERRKCSKWIKLTKGLGNKWDPKRSNLPPHPLRQEQTRKHTVYLHNARHTLQSKHLRSAWDYVFSVDENSIVYWEFMTVSLWHLYVANFHKQLGIISIRWPTRWFYLNRIFSIYCK